MSTSAVETNAAVEALTDQIVRLSARIRDMERERDAALIARRKAEADEQEWRGIVETYGRVRQEAIPSKATERFIFEVDTWVFRATAGEPSTFIAALRPVFDEMRARFKLRAR